MRSTPMHVVRLAVVIIALWPLVACAADRTVDFTIAAINAENFFDAFDDPYTQDETAYPKPKNASIALGKVMQAVDADFIGIEEIENEGIVVRFRGWNLANRGYDYHFCGQSLGTRGINNALLSRIPVSPIAEHKYARTALPDDPKKRTWVFARNPIEATLRPASDVAISVFVVHFKSKRTVDKDDPQSSDQRLAEAIAMRKIIDERLAKEPQAMIAVIGDFNDTADSKTLAALLAPAADGKPALIDPHADIPAPANITYLRDPYKSRIDYTLLSPALAKHLKPGSAKIYNDGYTGSDHAPVAVSFSIPTADADARASWPSGEPEREIQTYFKKGDEAKNLPEPEPAAN